jgi:hypothetical protein
MKFKVRSRALPQIAANGSLNQLILQTTVIDGLDSVNLDYIQAAFGQMDSTAGVQSSLVRPSFFCRFEGQNQLEFYQINATEEQVIERCAIPSLRNTPKRYWTTTLKTLQKLRTS